MKLRLLLLSLIAILTLISIGPLRHSLAIAKAPKTSFKMPNPPKGPPPRGRVRGGAQRGTFCPFTQPTLTALTPYVEHRDPEFPQLPPTMDVWGYTTQTHPTFWFYLPYPKATGYQAEFILQDATETVVYRQAIALPEHPGVIAVSLPKSHPGLALAQPYRWYFALRCQTVTKMAAYPIVPDRVEGVVQRLQPSLKLMQQLAIAPPLEQARLYAEAGIWFDAITTLATLHQAKPSESIYWEEWNALLQSIHLEEVSQKPLVPSIDEGFVTQ